MRASFGVLFAAGWRLDDVMALSRSQMRDVVACVVAAKVESLNVLAGALGVKGTTVRTASTVTQAKDEAALVGFFKGHGVRVVQSPAG